ncbi:MAG TPA: hypothetical protein VMT69_03985 [Kineosporiaceae bacterium]|nr:hypothetical protein [Kineosporiaceae bacterium]
MRREEQVHRPGTGQAAAAECVRYLLTAGALLAAGVVVCIDRAPKPVNTSDGLSWFGVTRQTVVEYGITLLVTAALMLRAAVPLAALASLRPARLGLVVCAALLPLMLATPYTVSTFMNWTHMTIGSVLFATQLLLSGWLWWARARTPLVLGLLLVEFAGGLVCFSSLLDLNDAMLYGQLVFQVAFTGCVSFAILAAATGAAPRRAGRAIARPSTGHSTGHSTGQPPG